MSLLETLRRPLLDNFPALRPENLCITSERTSAYNCIAWAADDSGKWWWPAKFYWWPNDIPREHTLDAFTRLYRRLGYEICDNGRLESGAEKIVIYCSNGLPTHAARQLPDGTWTSKLGRSEDIIHRSPHDLSGSEYGKPERFMKRTRKQYVQTNPNCNVKRVDGDSFGKLTA